MKTKKYSITKKVKEIGFDLFGFTRPIVIQKDKKNYRFFLDNNYHGQMTWLEKHFEKKINPKKLWKKTKSILVLGLSYSPDENPFHYNENKCIGNISIYARNRDYHSVIKEKLKKLQDFLNNSLSIESRSFVDSAPVFEKSLAQQAGLGWIGKHTNLVSRKIGSWFFLAELYLSEIIPPDDSELDHCGSCDLCIRVCPTGAIVDEFTIDARKCISYLTIEHKGPIVNSLRSKMGNKIFGCDDCLAVCPWNKFSCESDNSDFKRNNSFHNAKLEHYLKIKKSEFKRIFKDSSIYRIGWVSFIRNVLIAAGNSKKKNLIRYVLRFLKNESPIVRGTAIWSIGQLMEKEQMKIIKKKYILNENNRYVLYEWNNF